MGSYRIQQITHAMNIDKLKYFKFDIELRLYLRKQLHK